jgi:hypothetical protein
MPHRHRRSNDGAGAEPVTRQQHTNRTDADGRKRINKLAEKLVKCALIDGESWAFNMIADRLEGKPMQPVEYSGTDDRDIKELTDAELTALIRSQLKIVPVEATDEERPEGESLN